MATPGPSTTPPHLARLTPQLLFHSITDEAQRAKRLAQACDNLSRSQKQAPEYWKQGGGWEEDWAWVVAWLRIGFAGRQSHLILINEAAVTRIANTVFAPLPDKTRKSWIKTTCENISQKAEEKGGLLEAKEVVDHVERLRTASLAQVVNVGASTSNATAPVPAIAPPRIRVMTVEEFWDGMKEAQGLEEAINGHAKMIAADGLFLSVLGVADSIPSGALEFRRDLLAEFFTDDLRKEIGEAAAAKTRKLNLAGSEKYQRQYGTIDSFIAMIFHPYIAQRVVDKAIKLVRSSQDGSNVLGAPLWLPRISARVPSRLVGSTGQVAVLIQQSQRDLFRQSQIQNSTNDRAADEQLKPEVPPEFQAKISSLENQIGSLTSQLAEAKLASGSDDLNERCRRYRDHEERTAALVNGFVEVLPISPAASTLGGARSAIRRVEYSKLDTLWKTGSGLQDDSDASDDEDEKGSGGPAGDNFDQEGPRGFAASAPASFLDPPKSSQQLYDQLSSALTRTLNLFLTPGATQILYKTLATSFMTRLESLMLDVKEDVENALAKIHNGEEVLLTPAEKEAAKASLDGAALFSTNLRALACLSAAILALVPAAKDLIVTLHARLCAVLALLLLIEDTILVLPCLDSLFTSLKYLDTSGLAESDKSLLETCTRAMRQFALGAAFACSFNLPLRYYDSPDRLRWIKAYLHPSTADSAESAALPLSPCHHPACAAPLIMPTSQAHPFERSGPNQRERLSVGSHEARRGEYLPSPLFAIIIRVQVFPCPVYIIFKIFFRCVILPSFAFYGYIFHYRCRNLRGKRTH